MSNFRELIPVDRTKESYIFRVAKVNDPTKASIPRQRVPNSVSIPSTDEVLMYNEDEDIEMPVMIRYSTQEKTIVRDKQSDYSKESIIELGRSGYVELFPKKDAILISYLLNCNYNMDNANRNPDKKIIFREIRLEEAEDRFLIQKKRINEAVSYVFDMDETELRDYAQAIGKKVEGVTPTRLRAELTAYAERDADVFFDNLNSPEFKMIIDVNKALSYKILVNNGGSVKLVSANRILLSIPAGAVASKELAHYFLSAKGKDDWSFVFAKIEEQEAKKNVVKESYKKTLESPAKTKVEELTVADLFENCANAKIIERKSPYYYYGEENLGKSKNDVYQKIDEDEVFRKQLQAQLVMHLG